MRKAKKRNIKEYGVMKRQGTFVQKGDDGSLWSEVEIEGNPYMISKIDTTHFKMMPKDSFERNLGRPATWHVRQFDHMPDFYNSLKDWLHGGEMIGGKSFDENKQKSNTMTIKENVRVGDYLLEKGDKIEVFGKTKKNNKKKESVRKEDTIKAIKRALVADLEAEDVEYIGESTYGRGFDFEASTANNGESEWCIFLDIEDAENEARKAVMEDLDEMPESFNRDFLMNHVYISPTDINIIANEEAVFQIEDMDEGEILEQANMEDEYENAETEEEREDIWEKAKEAVMEPILQDWQEGLKEDPVDFLVNDKGIYLYDDEWDLNFIQINAEEAAEEAVNIDGEAHFLDRYDGEMVEITDPKTNDTFYAYGTN